MAAGKWIPELVASTPVADAARLALAKRLAVTRDYLQLALAEPEKDIEHVHQLRVGTRRAGAVLEIFQCCLPAAEHRRARKYLRNLRRAAGEARDWDVFLLALGKQRPRSVYQQPGWDLLTGFALAERLSAQDHIVASSPDFPFAFERLLAETVAAVQKPRQPEVRTLLDLARPLLADLVKDLHEAMEGDLEDYPHLHQVRIAGKRLRYAMEVVADCFEPTFKDQSYAAVEEMQEILGDVNDAHVARQRLSDHLDHLALLKTQDARRYKPAFQALIRQHEKQLTAGQQRFRDWLERWQAMAGEQRLLQIVNPQSPAMKLHDDGFGMSAQAGQEPEELAGNSGLPAQA